MHVAGRPWRAVVDPAASILDQRFITNGGGGGGQGESARARCPERKDATGGVAGQVEGEVHVMVVPWRERGAEDRTKFKVSGLRSC